MREIIKIVLLLTLTFSFLLVSNAGAQQDEIAMLNGDLVTAYNAKKYDEALVSAKRLVEATTQKFGKDSIPVALALKNKGFIEHAKGDDKQADKTLSEAMRIFKAQAELSNADAASFGSLLETLAKIRSQDKFESGESLLESALQWREKGNGANSKEVAYVLANLANRKYWHREFKPAAELYKRSLLILSKLPVSPAETDRVTIYARTQCAYRKAKIEDQFDLLKLQYEIDVKENAASVPELVQGGVVNGKAISIFSPNYPKTIQNYPNDSKKVSAFGDIPVEVLISEKGDVISACAAAGLNLDLVESSEAAALKSKFTPTTIGGRPIKVSGTITYGYYR
jgi:hypothetical protein